MSNVFYLKKTIMEVITATGIMEKFYSIRIIAVVNMTDIKKQKIQSECIFQVQ